MHREIVSIDEDLCDGCGLCIPNCAEGALQIINGKAKLVSDALCDGLGACLGHCPQGAIKIERREAQAFDEDAVKHKQEMERIKSMAAAMHSRLVKKEMHEGACASGGCPGSSFRSLKRQENSAESVTNQNLVAEHNQEGQRSVSALSHWPVQLRLLSPQAPVLRNARLLVAADCVSVACAQFHSKLLPGHAVVISCPKFDPRSADIEKLVEIIRCNSLEEITVARMEVPCCLGIVQAVMQAKELAGSDVPVKEIVISCDGEVRETFPPNVCETN